MRLFIALKLVSLPDQLIRRCTGGKELLRFELTHGNVSRYDLSVPTNLKLDDKLLEETVKLGRFKSKREAVNTALAEFVHRRQRLRILDLGGKIEFDPNWDYKKMRRGRS
jgi:Arc/MetJ family transcription regulator